MRRSLVLLAFFLSSGLAATVPAQPPLQQARELRVQLEGLQAQLDALARQDSSSGHKVTEIGSNSARQRDLDQPRLVVRIYDLSDLYAIAPAYVALEPGDLEDSGRAIFPEVVVAEGSRAGMGGGGFGGGMGGFFAVPASSSRLKDRTKDTLAQASGGGGEVDAGRTTVDGLIETITSTIAPEEWNDVGGPSSIKALGASLIISAPVNVHDQIGALLDLFRKRWGSLRTVSLQAHWLWLTEAQLAAAVAQPAAAAPGEPRAFGALSDAGWKQLREAAAGEDAGRPGYHAVLTCYNGQTVNTLAGRQRLIVGGMTPVVGGQEQAAYQPNVRAVHEGAALQITPVVTRTAKYVVVDVHSRVNLLTPVEPAVAAPQPQSGPVEQVVAAIDRQPLQSQRLSTTLRIPTGRPTLVGGMTFRPDGAGERNLYLFVTAVVQELRDEEGTEVKADPPAPEPAPENPKANE